MGCKQQLWAAVAVATVILSPEAGAQGRGCDGGRGIRVADLGFAPLPRATRSGPGTGVAEVYLADARVRGVRQDGPAAGRLMEGDVLVALDGMPIESAEAATRHARIKRGEPVVLTVRRGERTEEVTLTAGEACAPLAPHAPGAPLPAVTAAVGAPGVPLPPGDELLPRAWYGVEVACDQCGKSGVGAERRVRFAEPLLVVDVQAGTPAARAGLRSGDRLTHLDGLALTSEEGSRRFAKLRAGERVVWTYERDGRSYDAATGG